MKGEGMKIFVAHSFASPPLTDYRDAYYAVAARMSVREGKQVTFLIAEGAKSANAAHILDEIEEEIAEADAVICDLTSLSPNVIFEAGLARASMKPLVLLLKAPADDNLVPSDLQGFQRKQYASRHELESALEGIVRRLEQEVKEDDPSEDLNQQIGWAVESMYQVVDLFMEPMRISDFSNFTGVEQGILRELLKPLIEDGRVYREGEASGTRYGTVVDE